MEYLLLAAGGVLPVDNQDTYCEVEKCMREYPGSAHYWVNVDGWWRKTCISALGDRKTERLDTPPPDMVKLAAMLE